MICNKLRAINKPKLCTSFKKITPTTHVVGVILVAMPNKLAFAYPFGEQSYYSGITLFAIPILSLTTFYPSI